MGYPVQFVVSATLFAAPTADGQLPRNIKPVVVWTGIDSKQAKELFSRCVTQKDWQAIWHKHQGRDERTDERTCPIVDFDSYMVVAIFHGSSYQNKGIEIVAVAEERDCVRVRYRPLSYQTARGEGGKEVEVEDTQSYAFIVLPRSQKAIVLDENVQFPSNPLWKERAKLAALNK